MPRGVKKENLPSKICEVCKRPFTWRKVWERCWDDVKTCSDRCKAERKKQNKANREALQAGSDANQNPNENVSKVVDIGNSSELNMRLCVAGMANPQASLHHFLLFAFSPRKFLSLDRIQYA
ncbi:uncharacterized protein [Physcomitrium patens]|uniref:DUF2256 domain-containing protein n=1 Tax=Physcomitrium patens TaxID=3218 RepID=A0A2K1KGH2_PHYPA|nr:uncharacterized protein LOC112283284 [Physcomitrium patens]PNR52887.1 hypothetical protein PHYPA_009262 [Physcomitrium patens]|eukprot:XP_024377584.1 uncharacterized protein LOC112283284 [Physcomitrella patens]